MPGAPYFKRSLTVDHARDGEVMIAFAMNGRQPPLLNGFPLRLVVPGWYSTYRVKMLSNIEVLDKPDDNLWMRKAYLIPDTPDADVRPGRTGVKMVPIGRMMPRSFVTNLVQGAKVRLHAPTEVRGIAFGGNSGVARVDFSADSGKTWRPARLGTDEGNTAFANGRWRSLLARPGHMDL